MFGSAQVSKITLRIMSHVSVVCCVYVYVLILSIITFLVENLRIIGFFMRINRHIFNEKRIEWVKKSIIYQGLFNFDSYTENVRQLHTQNESHTHIQIQQCFGQQ